MSRILFLGVDGVLNHRKNPKAICQIAAERLMKVVDDADALIVMTASLRLGGHCTDAMREVRQTGAGRRMHSDWRTKDLSSRGIEIAEWLSRHPEAHRYAIVDDDSDMLPEQQQFFVQTSFETGLLDHHADKLIEILKS
jgi:HAD domain in Swiss Army Knife RNA repair proteins